jgi:aspartyl-tRNA(Asn)/glutamyl-tRNA(Gln) amidotransferase subunit A
VFSFTTIADYKARLETRTITCTEAVQHYLRAIFSHTHLNAFLEVFAEEALQRAAFLDRQETQGPLHGVIIGIKDNICYKDHHCSAASRMLEGFTSVYNATAVQRLVDAGAIIIGRQNCDEFGMGSTNENSAYGPASNPIDETRVPGGSSGGSAAAVAAGLCMASLGSDTGGSVRLPADFCGVVGLKPTYGKVSRYGLIAYASSFDVIGVLAKNPEDAFTILSVIEGPDAFDSTAIQHPKPSSALSTDTKLRIGYFPEWIQHPSIDPEISQAITSKINELKSAGHTVNALPFEFTDYIVPAYYVLTTAEASSNLSRYDGVRFGKRSAGPDEDLANFYRINRSEGFGTEVKRRIMLGSFVLSTGYYDAYFTKAQQVRQLLKQQTNLIFNNFDVLIAPNAPSVAYQKTQKQADPVAVYLGDIFTVFANLTGVPALSLPLFQHSSNIPFGLQLIAAEQNEVFLQRISHQLMQ